MLLVTTCMARQSFLLCSAFLWSWIYADSHVRAHDNPTRYKRCEFLSKYQFNEEVEFKLKVMSNSEEEMLDNTELSDDNYVTYIIGEGTEIVIHRFKIELEDGQDIEAVIKQLDDEMEAMHGQIRFRMDWNYNFVQW